MYNLLPYVVTTLHGIIVGIDIPVDLDIRTTLKRADIFACAEVTLFHGQQPIII